MAEPDERIAVVTGAAAGIGRAIAVRLAADGCRVVVADRVRSPWHGGPDTVDVIRDAGGVAEFAECDLGVDPGGLLTDVVGTHGRLDVLVNNAATSLGKPLLDTGNDDWDRVLAVNLTAPFRLCREAVRQLLTQDRRGEVRGRIVNITSQHGIVAAPEDVAYGVSKAALAQLTRQLAVEFAPHGIVCNAVAPGKIDTGPTDRSADPRWQQYWTSRTPWPRLGRPDDVAAAVSFLAGDQATYLTGATLMVDGGWTAN